MKKIIFIVLFMASYGYGSTMYMLTKFPKVYLVVENYSQKVSQETKSEIYEELKSTTDELKIDTKGYSHRSLAILLYDTPVENDLSLNIELALGEMVQRVDDKQEVFSLTYQQKKQILYKNKSVEEINELVLDNIMILLSAFSEQYQDDNKNLTNNIGHNYKDFAKDLGYETDYKNAIQRAKKEEKNIMFVMVANFCPWCVKFEKYILSKNSYNKKIQKKYIPLIINREENNFPKQFQTPLVPAIYFINYKDETIENKVVGYNNRFEFFRIIEK